MDRKSSGWTQWLFVAAVFVATVGVSGEAAASNAGIPQCWIFVHGHRGGDHSTSAAEASAAWTSGNSSFIKDVVNFYGNGVYANDRSVTVAWDTHKYYWDASKEVAMKIARGIRETCLPAIPGNVIINVVAHSMGNQVLDFIYGNATSDDAYHHYGNTTELGYNGNYFKYIDMFVTRSVSVAGPHRGSRMANCVCGTSCNIVLDGVIGTVTNSISAVTGRSYIEFISGETCDRGMRSLQLSSNWQVYRYMSAPRTPVYLIAGFEQISGSDAILYGQNDGAVDYASAYACTGGNDVAYGVSSQCTGHMESSNFYNCDQTDEDHDQIRNGADRDERRSASDGYCWYNSSGRITTANYRMRSSMSTAEFIRCKWGVNPGHACD